MKKTVKDSIGYLTARASYALASQVYRNFQKQEIDLPHAQFIILRHLYENDGMTQQEMADSLFKDKAAIKRTVESLMLRGYVSRVKKGKTFKIFLTASAKKIKGTVQKIADATIRQSLKGVDAAEYEICLDVLKKITENLKTAG
ncbi:MAG TPA: MarR family winged helix-turn-helix transcriptional regulator [Spirochaetota bacterium]|nr:MarR family winged helix-turn-helix transcriptional regulator [Spirochaetota bacterium]HPJ33436.1 MarR family winged helix-turn-helix transcriptional regulator [Spirochaetota bacterium]